MDARELSARPRPLVGLRCAWCHDALADEEADVCAGCATRRHAACVAEAPACPTLGCAWRGRTRRRITVGPPLASWLTLTRAAPLLVPVLCFALNETLTVGETPLHAFFPGAETFGGAWDPAAQRPLYPALAWALAARGAALAGRRGGWVQAGLEGGVGLAALFSLLYLPVLPLALVLVVALGLGLLGFGPLLTLAGFVGALRRYRAAAPAGEVRRSLGLARLLFAAAAWGGLVGGLAALRPVARAIAW